MALAVEACSSQAASGTGGSGGGEPAGTGGGPGGGGASTGGGGATGGQTGGPDGGRPIQLVTFAFTGHVTGLISVDISSDGYAPAVGDPFTGSYTFNALQLGTVSGDFLQGGPANVAADLTVNALTGTFPSANAPDANEPSFGIISTATTYSVSINAFAVPSDLFGQATGFSFSWTLSNPNGTGVPPTQLSTVPPDLSVWTQASDAVLIQLIDYSGISYRANGVIDTIQAR